MKPARPGPPSVFGPPVTKRILAALAEGNYRSAAAKHGGISYETLRQWIRRGEAGEEPFAKFVADVLEAEANAEVEAVGEMRRAEPKEWLARRYPNRWAKKENLRASITLEQKAAALTDEQVHAELVKAAQAILAAEAGRKDGEE